jgi:hypothetical protein
MALAGRALDSLIEISVSTVGDLGAVGYGAPNADAATWR